MDDTSSDRARLAATAAADKGATEITILDVAEVLRIVDCFVIVSASNARMVRAVAEEVEDRIRQASGESPRSVEGLDDLRWVLIDYGDVVVHVFLDEVRAYYELERLWGDVPRVSWEGEERHPVAR